MNNGRVVQVGFFLVLLFLTSCQRSPQYRRDESYEKETFASRYYTSVRNSKGVTQRVENSGQPKKRAFVLNFWNDTPVKIENLDSFAADELRRGLALTQRVLIPEDAKTDFGTQEFVDGDRVKVPELVREGRRLGLSTLLIGRIKKIIFRQNGDDVGLFRQKKSLVAVELEAKMFDVQGGRELMASVKVGESSSNVVVAFEGEDASSPAFRAELIRNAVREAIAAFIPEVMKAIDKLAWQGRIAKVAGPKIFINAGRASGLSQGDILRVMTSGDDVYDPLTGSFLGHSEGQLKGTLEVFDFVGLDGSVTQVHTGGNFREGDLVQLY